MIQVSIFLKTKPKLIFLLNKMSEISTELEDHLIYLCSLGEYQVASDIIKLLPKSTPKILMACAYCEDETTRTKLFQLQPGIELSYESIISCLRNKNYRPLINYKKIVIKYEDIRTIFKEDVQVFHDIFRYGFFEHETYHSFLPELEKTGFDLDLLEECCYEDVAIVCLDKTMDKCRKKFGHNIEIEFMRHITHVFNKEVKIVEIGQKITQNINLSGFFTHLCPHTLNKDKAQELVDLFINMCEHPKRYINEFCSCYGFVSLLPEINFRGLKCDDIYKIDPPDGYHYHGTLEHIIVNMCISGEKKLDNDKLVGIIDDECFNTLERIVGKDELWSFIYKNDRDDLLLPAHIHSSGQLFNVLSNVVEYKCKRCFLTISSYLESLFKN